MPLGRAGKKRRPIVPQMLLVEYGLRPRISEALTTFENGSSLWADLNPPALGLSARFLLVSAMSTGRFILLAVVLMVGAFVGVS
jgi:hypothetical protein